MSKRAVGSINDDGDVKMVCHHCRLLYGPVSQVHDVFDGYVKVSYAKMCTHMKHRHNKLLSGRIEQTKQEVNNA